VLTSTMMPAAANSDTGPPAYVDIEVSKSLRCKASNRAGPPIDATAAPAAAATSVTAAAS